VRDLDAWMNRYRQGDRGLALTGLADQRRGA